MSSAVRCLVCSGPLGVEPHYTLQDLETGQEIAFHARCSWSAALQLQAFQEIGGYYRLICALEGVPA